MVLTMIGEAPLAVAQQPADSIREAALRDYHGPDLEGKDGPLAKAGLDLLVLYHEYQAHRDEGADTSFTPNVSGVRVVDGRVTVDAIASGSADTLRQELEALGLTNAATAGRVVSGRVPLDRVPDLAKLESLRSVAPSRMQTRTDPGASGGAVVQPGEQQARPVPSQDTTTPSEGQAPPLDDPGDTAQAPPPETPSQTSPSDSTSPTPDPASAEGTDGFLGTGALLGILAVLAGLLGLFFVFRR